MRVAVAVEKDCRLSLISLGTSGQAVRLFPNEFQPDNVIRAGQTVLVPSIRSPIQFKARGPAGVEGLVATCSSLNAKTELPPIVPGEFANDRRRGKRDARSRGHAGGRQFRGRAGVGIVPRHQLNEPWMQPGRDLPLRREAHHAGTSWETIVMRTVRSFIAARAAGLGALMLVSASGRLSRRRRQAAVAGETRDLAESMNKLGGALLGSLAGNRSSETVVVSPYGLGSALHLLSFGAGGRAQQALRAKLLPPGFKTVQHVEGLIALKRHILGADRDKLKLTVASAVFIPEAAKPWSQFVGTALGVFDAAPEVLNFADKAAVVRINAWAKAGKPGADPAPGRAARCGRALRAGQRRLFQRRLGDRLRGGAHGQGALHARRRLEAGRRHDGCDDARSSSPSSTICGPSGCPTTARRSRCSSSRPASSRARPRSPRP